MVSETLLVCVHCFLVFVDFLLPSLSWLFVFACLCRFLAAMCFQLLACFNLCFICLFVVVDLFLIIFLSLVLIAFFSPLFSWLVCFVFVFKLGV